MKTVLYSQNVYSHNSEYEVLKWVYVVVVSYLVFELWFQYFIRRGLNGILTFVHLKYKHIVEKVFEIDS